MKVVNKNSIKTNTKEQLSSKDFKETPNGENIKGIIFDFDGVLSSFVVRLGWPIASSALMVKKDISKKQIDDFSFEVFEFLNTLDEKPNNANLIKFAFHMGKKLGMSTFQAFKFILTIGIVYSKSRKNIVPKAGIRKVLRELLAQDYKVVLLTNTSWGVINKAKEKIPELNDFDLILTRDDVKKIKPDASGILKVMKILNLKREEIISIGDQASDIIANKRAGVKSIAVNAKAMAFTKSLLTIHEPEFIISDLREIPNILRFLRDSIIDDIRTTIDLTETSLNEYILENHLHAISNP
ncbi:MAG: HAD hydrolase-like protein [Candidatus Thorarchaeota archaeon]